MSIANPSPLNAEMPEGLAARSAALALLHGVLRQNQALEQAMESPEFRALSGQNRAFALRLAKIVCRRLGQLDALIAHFLQSPLPANANAIHDILRLGLAEGLFAAIPAHAAVHSAVELAKRGPQARLSGLVNALLKRALQEGPAMLAAQDGFALNLPDWFRARLLDAYGEATARAIYQAQLQEPPLDLSAKQADASLAERLGAVLLPTGSLRLAQNPSLESLDGYAQGEWWVQDAAAALPVRLLGDVKGQTVLDLCAAPGGKTAQLASQEAHVVALDRSARRLARLRENLARLNLSADILTADALTWQPPQAFSHLLLDAPCSATGTLRRNPDVILHRNETDLAKLTALQEKLLNRAFSWLSPGGTLVYAVCSLLPEEGERQIERLLKRHTDARLSPVQSEEIGHLGDCITAEGMLRTLPCHLAESGGMDGFFAARIIKMENA